MAPVGHHEQDDQSDGYRDVRASRTGEDESYIERDDGEFEGNVEQPEDGRMVIVCVAVNREEYEGDEDLRCDQHGDNEGLASVVVRTEVVQLGGRAWEDHRRRKIKA